MGLTVKFNFSGKSSQSFLSERFFPMRTVIGMSGLLALRLAIEGRIGD